MLTPEQSAAVVEWLNERVGRGPGQVSQVEFALMTGVSQQTISTLTSGARTCGYAIALRFALYAGIPVDEFISPLPRALRRMLHDRQIRPRWSEPAIAAMCTIATDNAAWAETLTEREWTERLDQLSDAIAPIEARIERSKRSRDAQSNSQPPIVLHHRKPPCR